MPPPPLFQVWDPDPAGRPRRWNKPWQLIHSHTGKDNAGKDNAGKDNTGKDNPGKDSQAGFPDKDPNLRMASSAEHPTVSKTQVSKENQSTLLGYFWNFKEDTVSTNKNLVINLMPARRGVRLSWRDIAEAEDLLRLYKERLLTHRHALACAHLLYDPVGTPPFLTAALKYMYRSLIMTQSLESEVGANYDKVLSEYVVSNHL